jgi:hypothetical protein
MNGSLWHIDLSYACNFDPPSEADVGCPSVFFDIFKNDLKYSDNGFMNLRFGRTGVAFLVYGLYLMYLLTRMTIKDDSSEPKIAFDNNIWNNNLWRRI